MKSILRASVAAAFILAAGANTVISEVKIGVLYPIAGTGAVYGTPAMHGHNMAVDEVNAAGGIMGQKVVTFARDTKLKPADAEFRHGSRQVGPTPSISIFWGAILGPRKWKNAICGDIFCPCKG